MLGVGEERFLTGFIYTPPCYTNSCAAKEINKSIRVANGSVDSGCYNGPFVAGDFNYPSIKWIDGVGIQRG